jgi:hypothetical protein
MLSLSLRSVTFASGIMATSVKTRLVTSISRFSVTTKYRRHQMAIFQPCHTNSTPHSSQMARTSLPLPWAALGRFVDHGRIECQGRVSH